MQSDWKNVLMIAGILTVLILSSNCAWVIRTREEINRPPIDLTPMPESLLVLPDSSSIKYDPILWFQIRAKWTYNKPTQPILTYTINADGKFNVFYGRYPGQENIDLGYLERGEIQELIYVLNNMGFLKTGEERLLYEHYDVERIFLFGVLIKTKRRVVQNYPSDVTYHFDFKLKNFNYKNDYYGIKNVTDKPEHIQELQILRNGSTLVEKFFEDKALVCSEKLSFKHNAHNALEYPIVPACSLDEKLQVVKKFSTLVPVWITENIRENDTVVIKLLVGPDGHVIYGIIQETSGGRYFDYKALEYSKRVTFTPPKHHGNPVCSWISKPFSPIIGEP